MRRSITRSTKVLVFGTLAAMLILFGAIVWAQGDPYDPEGGRSADSAGDTAGHEDEVEVPDGPGPNAPAAASQDPEGDTTPPAAPAPNAVEEVEMDFDPQASSGEVFLFKFIAGANFHPRESTTTHAYGGAGCAYRTSPTGFLVSDLQLPEGAEIDFMRLYFEDDNADNDAQLYLYTYDGEGDFTQIATAASSGAPGQGSAGSGFFSHIVDNTAESLGVVAGTQAASDNSVNICGVRLRYKVDVPSWALLPAVLKQVMGE